MSFKRLLRALGGIGAAHGVKPVVYRVRYTVRVKNLSDGMNRIGVVLPVPPDTEYQKLSGPPEFSPASWKLGEAGSWSNGYVTWEDALAYGAEGVYKESFSVRVAPREVLPSSDPEHTWEDYEKFRREDPSLFEGPPHLSLDDPLVREFAENIRRSLRKASPYKAIEGINRRIIARLQYGDPIEGLYSASDALRKDKVDCGGFDTLFAAACMSLGIPARILCGFWAGYGENTMHAWAEAMLPDGMWVPVDPSVEYLREAGRTEKEGGFGYTGADRVVLSVGSDIVFSLRKKRVELDILQNPYVDAEQGQDSVKAEWEFMTEQA